VGTGGGTAWAGRGLITNPADVGRVIADVNAASVHRDRTAAMAHAVRTADDVALPEPDASRVLPVAPEIAKLLPWPGGLLRGSTVATVGSLSLVMTLLADAMAAGSWAAIVGVPQFGALAAGTAPPGQSQPRQRGH
jgi:hypothetical protein